MLKLRGLAALLFSTLTFGLHAQFAPPAGFPGTTAISKDSSVFVDWASACQIERGFLDIAYPDSGYVSFGDATASLGRAGENGFVSLGDGGSATLSFANEVFNGPGFDFAVFENGFFTGTDSLAFLELAAVEVSSDGVSFFRFLPESNIQDTAQLPMTGIDASLIHNLAGKYTFGYGTPFDLEELKDEPGLDVNHITHIRVTDVVGSINPQYATLDKNGRKINDPYPTPFPSGGFDLDAVGVIHSNSVNSVDNKNQEVSNMSVYPNPALRGALFTVKYSGQEQNPQCQILEVNGRVQQEFKLGAFNEVSTDLLTPGIYCIKCGLSVSKLVVQ